MGAAFSSCCVDWDVDVAGACLARRFSIGFVTADISVAAAIAAGQAAQRFVADVAP